MEFFDRRGWVVHGVDNNMRRVFFAPDGDTTWNLERLRAIARRFNADGTLNLLEAVRRYCAEACFVFMSTNKVYGDAPNELPLVELETRFDYADPEDYEGIGEAMRVDASLHSLFGASKLAADIMVLEYGRYFGIPAVYFRAGCLTGPNHSGAELPASWPPWPGPSGRAAGKLSTAIIRASRSETTTSGLAAPPCTTWAAAERTPYRWCRRLAASRS